MLPSDRPTLFPILPQPKGLARLAADAEPLGSGHLIEFRSLRVRNLLNRTSSRRRLALAWSINPYRGCEFGCKYCYARYTHEFLDASGGSHAYDAFEHRIYIKQNASWLLEQELRKMRPGEEIAIGTATDPYQPVERTVQSTRSILEVFARQRDHRIGIVTKSTLIVRDIDLLTRIAAHNHLVLHVTITTPDSVLARMLEPRAPRPDLRLRTVRRLRQAGLTAGILCSPLLPGLTDSAEAIDSMARHARAADSSFIAAEPLFLKPCSRPTYLSFIREHFPSLLAETTAHFASADFALPTYRSHLRHLVHAACQRYGVPERHTTGVLLTRGSEDRRGQPVTDFSPLQTRLFA